LADKRIFEEQVKYSNAGDAEIMPLDKPNSRLEKSGEQEEERENAGSSAR